MKCRADEDGEKYRHDFPAEARRLGREPGHLASFFCMNVFDAKLNRT
jgi:hypothetical protein